MKDFLSRIVLFYGQKVSKNRQPLIGVPNIRGQINWWQLAFILVSATLTGLIAAGNHVAGMQGKLAESIGGVLAAALVAAVTSGVAMLSGRPVEDIAEEIIDEMRGKDDDGAPRSDS